jgi:hypothetical protein
LRKTRNCLKGGLALSFSSVSLTSWFVVHIELCCEQDIPLLYKDKMQSVVFQDPVRIAQDTQSVAVIKNDQLMLFRTNVAVVSEIYTVRINVRCGHNVEFFIVTLEGTESNR